LLDQNTSPDSGKMLKSALHRQAFANGTRRAGSGNSTLSKFTLHSQCAPDTVPL
jgi:hypothetical protein